MAVDALDVVKKATLTVAGITQLVSTRIYINTNPGQFGNKPADGPYILISFRSPPMHYTGRIIDAQIQLAGYAPTEAYASKIGRAILDGMDDQIFDKIKHSNVTQYPITLQDRQGSQEDRSQWFVSIVWIQMFIEN